MAIEVKTTGLEDFEKALREYELISSKTREEVLRHRAGRLAFALHRAALEVGRAAMQKIRQISPRRMRVRTGDRTQRQEKARRIFAAGFVASGWLPAIRAFRSSGSVRALAKVGTPQGGVVLNIRAGHIDLVNSTPGAAEADAKHGISDRALRNQAEDMRKYLQARADRDLDRAWR
jgi:hypothetical protein